MYQIFEDIMSGDILRPKTLERCAQEMARLLSDVTRESFPAHKWAVHYNGYVYSLQMVGADNNSERPLSETDVVEVNGENLLVEKVFVDDDDPKTEISPKAYHALRRAFAAQGILSTDDRRNPSTEYPVRFL